MAAQSRNILLSLTCALIALAGVSPSANAQGGAISGQVITSFGYPAAAVPVRVCSYTSTGNPCTPTTTIYSDPLLATPIGNPTATDAYGNYSVFVPFGYYIVQITPSPGITYSYLVSSNGQASVYSVGLSMPSIFTVTGSPITTAGTLGVTLNNQTANTVLAGPASGSAAMPTFRALGTADLPFTYTGNTTELPTFSGAVTTGYGVKFDATGNLISTGTASGTVTSVGLSSTAPFLTIGSSPVTSSGVISLTFGATGNGSEVATSTGAGSTGNCAEWSSGNLIDAGGPCGTYYQTIQNAGTSLAQQPILNFDGTVVATAGTGKTNVGLPTIGTAGTYTPATSITVDAYGRVSSISGGSTLASTCSSYSSNFAAGCTVMADGKIMQWVTGLTSSPTGSSPTAYSLGGTTIYVVKNNVSEQSWSLNWPITTATSCMLATVSTGIQDSTSSADVWWQIIGAPSTTGISVQLQQSNGQVTDGSYTWPIFSVVCR